MHRVLIISPHFPPVNAPDHQRVRMALPYLRELGWDATVLAIEPNEIDGLPRDALLEQTIPADVEIVRTRAVPLAIAGRLGMRTLGLRAYPNLARAGARLLRIRKFDLVFFSTTQFAVMALGPSWLARFGVPYVLDFQDPWVSDYHARRDPAAAPGGRWKYAFSQWIARRLEPKTVRACAHALCVSPAYPEMLRARYQDVEPTRFSVLPFAVAEQDFETARGAEVRQNIFDPSDGRQHWVYVGRGQADMAQALRGFFLALARAIEVDPPLRQRVAVHFVGTSYASGDRAAKTVEPIAHEFGLADCVTEHPHRIPYFTALRCLLDADALIFPGSDDPSYTASKLMPCLFAQKPLLAIFHEASPVVTALRSLDAGTVVTFREGTPTEELGGRILDQWFRAGPEAVGILARDSFAPYTAEAMTRTLVGVFDQALRQHDNKFAAKPN